MSQQSERILEGLIEHRDEYAFDRAVNEVYRKCGVKKDTAKAYIRTSDVVDTDHNEDGDEVIVPKGSVSRTSISDDADIVEMEVGEPTGNTFGELNVLEDVGHPEVPIHAANGYIRRRMSTMTKSALRHKTDIQVVTATMADDDFSTLLIGKHGVGKDFLILHICANTNRPTIRLVANDDPDFVDLLVGTYAPDENGNFARKKGLLQIGMENGYTFILDEFNALSGKVQTMLNKILEDSNKNQLVIPQTNQVIEPHPEFNFVATMNPNEIGYGGREDLDQATGSRFFPIRLPALDTDGEKRVVANETEWTENSDALDALLRESGGVFQGIRSLHDSGRVSMWPSTRDAIQIGRMANRLNDAKAAAELILVGRADADDKSAIREAVHDTRW